MRRAILAAASIALACAAQARVAEEEAWIEAKALDRRGNEVSHRILVTIYYETDAPRPYPALILNHGRAGAAAARNSMRISSYAKNSRWFAARGFLVAVPTRIGYGVT